MKSFALTTLVTACLLAAPALAMDDATKAALQDCQTSDTTAAKGVEACTKVLNGVKMGPQSQTAIYYYRGAFFLGTKNNEKAKSDFAQAIETYEKDSGKADWQPNFVGLVASSYAFRGQIELAAKDCPSAKADFGKAATTEREVSQREQYEAMARNACK